MKVALSLVSALTVSSLLFSGNVRAADQTINDTGPGSTNSIFDSEKCKIGLHNNTDITLGNSNDQSSTSGSSSSDGNTTSGDATSGSASNSNGTDINLGVSNGGASCTPVATPVTPVTPVTPGGGQGGGQVEGVSTTGGRGGGSTLGASQVSAPVGGVSAGAGGALLSVVVTSIASLAIGGYRLRKLGHA
jgi:hypothetical protein